MPRDRGHVREGEADVVIGDPDRGILAIEVKAGEIRRDDRQLVGRGSASRDRRSSRLPTAGTPLSASSESCPTGPLGLNPIAGAGRRLP